ncbi:marine proteobacterial sortase target protein [Aliiglaciecola litoralis]|uniref:Marine proteobacterial sortase target protein n=1 Tax=Aliiglaciecola litoralis TaxID=582857 RepID=A0ABP3WPT7_9ALTE
MKKHLRFVVVLSLLFLIWALQYAAPLLSKDSQAEASQQSTFKIDVSYQSTSVNRHPVHVSDYHDVEQGSFFLQASGQADYQLAPLLDTQVDMTITGLIARARVTQAFTNTSDQWLNGIYVFPLPENAAVDHLEMHIGKRRIVGEIHPKQKANAIYQQAKRDGKKASLLEQQRPNLFKNSVANIGPGERIQVTIEYQQAVEFSNNRFSLRFPTTITKRYLPAIGEPNEITIDDSGWGITQPSYGEIAALNNDKHQSESDSADLPIDSKSNYSTPKHKVALNITLNSGFDLETIESEFHPIYSKEIASGRYEISLQQSMIANQDFVLSWQPKADHNPLAAHFTQSTVNGHYGMVMMMPPDKQNDAVILPREVIFVIDTSGSMAGESMQQAKQALIYAVDNLPVTDSFNLVDFDSQATTMWQAPRTASLTNKQQAIGYIRGLLADGGTEILSALQLALGQQNPQSEKIRQVVFITDGSVGNESQLFGYIHDNLQHSRLFTVGIGSAPNSFFMSEAARMGKGSFTYIGSVDSVQDKMQELFSKLTHPILADLSLNFPQSVQVYPRNLPDLYKGEPLMISYKSATAFDRLTASGTLKNQYWQKTMSLQHSGSQTGLDVLWARRKIAQLDIDKVLGKDIQSVNQQIEDVAMAHHLVSSMTSLVAVDKTPSALQKSQDVQVNNHTPKGKLNGTLPQTATPAQLQFWMALLLMSIGLCTVIFTRNR